jgi:putative endonuclease
MYYVYFLKSLKNNKIYTGMTQKKPIHRLKEHNQGSNQWSRNNKPFDLIYFEKYFCKKDAQEREIFYKTGIGRKIRNCILKTMLEFNNKGI